MLDTINHLVAQIPGTEGTVVAVLAGLVDFSLRMIPSKKPLSVAYVISDCLKAVSQGLTKIAALMDRVLPQRVKEVATEASDSRMATAAEQKIGS